MQNARAIVAFFLFVGTIGALPAPARADGSEQDEISGQVGYLLPNQISGVTEVMPVFAFRYAYPLAPAFSVEAGVENTHAEGVDFTTLTLDARGEMEPLQGILAIFYGGVNFNWYAPAGRTERLTDWGGNVGSALMMRVTDSLWVRTDLKFNANPGTSLYLGFGLSFRGGAGGG